MRIVPVNVDDIQRFNFDGRVGRPHLARGTASRCKRVVCYAYAVTRSYLKGV